MCMLPGRVLYRLDQYCNLVLDDIYNLQSSLSITLTNNYKCRAKDFRVYPSKARRVLGARICVLSFIKSPCQPMLTQVKLFLPAVISHALKQCFLISLEALPVGRASFQLWVRNFIRGHIDCRLVGWFVGWLVITERSN